MSEIAKANNPDENHDHEKEFLKKAFSILEPALTDSTNDTTSYSPLSVVSGQHKGRGSSLESLKQRNEYTSLCTTGVTGQVLNISFKNKLSDKIKTKNCIEQVLSASDTVIKFIIQTAKYKNNYTEVFYESQKVNWQRNCTDKFTVAGGLLFPILTALLISYRSNNGIIVIIESYGGKKRGSHQHWKFNEIAHENILQTTVKLKTAEKRKIPFIIKNAFKIIHNEWPQYLTNISIHWGIGCDAMGKILSNGENSFLVCDAVQIPEIDLLRTEITSKVFANASIKSLSDISAVTRRIAKSKSGSDSDSDSDSNSDSDGGPIRHR